MINLYIVGNTNYTNNGDATLQPKAATIHKTINGAWQLSMELPYDEDGKYELLDIGAMIKVTDPSVSEIATTQLWRVYDYKRNINSVSVIAFPRAMEATFDAPITQLIISTDVTGAAAASSLSAVSEKYTVTSDIARTGRSEWNNTNLNRAICGTEDNAFVNVWGGEVVYDNTTIKILDGIGSEESLADVMYGKNISEISYEIDDSGLTTRVYPLSTDGIRYWDEEEEVQYIDSEKIEDYPIVHSNFMETPYKLIEDDASSISRTAVKTADIKNRIKTKASQLSHTIWNTAVSNGWKIDYMASIYKDIIANIQAMVTTDIAHADLVKVINAAVSEGMSWMGDQEDPEWTWIKVGEDAYKYGSDESGRYARNEWQYADKLWRWFGDNYYWQQPADDNHTWGWYEDQTTHKKRYGTRDRYYLAGQYIYITENGTMMKYWLDGDGWYDSDKTDESDYDWHQDPDAGGAWYFGTEDEDGNMDKHLSGCWAFIDGVLYWFDDGGHYYGEKKEQPPLDWQQSGEAWWFGDLNRDFDEIFVKSQWLKIDKEWYKFDSSGYTVEIHDSCIGLFHSGMGELTTLVQTCRSECYDLLYDLMEEWTEQQFQNGIDAPTVTINVNMIDLSRTTDYADYQNLETIHLGDTVRCVDYVHHIATIERVVELTYDLLRGYNTAVTIGVANSTVGSMLSGSTGGGSSSNNAINVDFIEQSLASKQAELVAGQNVTLTDNLDGTQTIASDKLIRAGENVSVTHNSDGSDTISASGGALTWWHENQSNLYSDNVYDGDTWHALQKYYFDYQVGWWNRIYSDRYREKKTTTPAIIGQACVKEANADRYWQYPIIISDIPDGVETVGFGGDQTYMLTFEYKGKTWYMGSSYGYFEGYGNPTPDASPAYGVFYGFTPADSQYHNFYPDNVTAGKALIDYAELSFDKTTYHGFARGDNLAFFAGGDDSTGTNAPIKIYSNGTYEGLDKVEDVQSDGASLVSNKIAIINTFEGATAQEAGVKGLVPAPTTDDVDRFLKGNGLWERVSQFVHKTPSEYNILPLSEKMDEKKLYLLSTDNTEDYYIEENNVTIKREGSMAVTAQARKTTFAWDGGQQIGAEADYLEVIDVTNINEIKYVLKTTTCYGHTSQNVEEQTNTNWHVLVGVVRTFPSGWVFNSLSSFLKYNRHKYTNTEYEESECVIDVSDITGEVYFLCSAVGWNCEISDISYLITNDAEKRYIKYLGKTYAEVGGNFEEMTSAEYNILPAEDKQDANVVHFINDTERSEVDIPVVMTNFYNRNEGAMSISVVDGELVYHWNGGSAIGASSYYPTVIPATVSKIKYKITTGGSYSTTTQRFKIAIGVKATYNTGAWASAEDTDWLAVDIQNTQNTEYEGEVDLSEITTDSYLMIGAHGWTVTFNEIEFVSEGEPTGTTKIMYKDVAYGAGGGGVECQYDSDTETLYFVNGAQYDSDTETIVIL